MYTAEIHVQAWQEHEELYQTVLLCQKFEGVQQFAVSSYNCVDWLDVKKLDSY